MDSTVHDRTPATETRVEFSAVKRPSREAAMEAVRTLIAWAGGAICLAIAALPRVLAAPILGILLDVTERRLGAEGES